MAKIKLYFLNILLVLCILLTGCINGSQQVFSKEVYSKQDLAKAILSETGISKKYDLYLGNSLDMAFPPETGKNDKFMAWMQALLVREAGWKYVEAKYVTQLEASFSETELRELLNLTKQPLMKKLLQDEIQSYTNTAGERRELLSKLWDNYNSGLFTPPPEVLQ